MTDVRSGVIRRARPSDFETIHALINEAAEAYRGVIPEDRWQEPYMPREELAGEIARGVAFWLWEEAGAVAGVMGLQDKGAVGLIRHAYVARVHQGRGIGTCLLRHLETRTQRPLLVGTWADARWAIRFYTRNGYRLVSVPEKERLLRRYWAIPERQIETSVVLAKTGHGDGTPDGWTGPPSVGGREAD
jgi:N-acetylglutamate synthase-like GNAT family acetyltransferase